MKKTALSIVSLLVSVLPALAGVREASDSCAAKVSFAYDVTAETYFNNIENDGGGNIYGESLTLFSARLTPEIGFKATTGGVKDPARKAFHKVMLGVNVTKDFGSKETVGQMFKEMNIYYNLKTKVSDKCDFEMNAGIFPRTAGKGYYSEAFFSDSLKFYDCNYEGILFGFTRPKAYFELGVDWMGQFGTDATTREKFMIFSAGNGEVLPWMQIGYSAYMLHYANSLQVRGLVDNILTSAYVDMDFGEMTGLQKLSLTAAYIQALQRDRMQIGKFTFPMGGELTAEVRNWNVAIRNKTYVGYSLMPYYNNTDTGGFKYGNNLYCGDPYYRVAPGNAASLKAGVYDRLEIAWEPRIARGLYFKVGAMFHFNGGAGTKFGFSGCNQVIAIRFRLEDLLNKTK